MVDLAAIRKRFTLLEGCLDERLRRRMAAAEAAAVGRGGPSAVSRATGVSRRAIRVGIRELKAPPAQRLTGRVRKSGGGRKRTVDTDPTLLRDLDLLVEPSTRGDPESPLRWTCKSVRQLARELTRMGHQTSHRMVAELLHGLDYRLQANRKTREGASHPDRNAQFEYINRKAHEFLRSKDPVVSVVTKKKELVGNFKNGGREWEPKGEPAPLQIHDFVRPDLGRAIPYGVYDLGENAGWVSVGIDHDTAAFAVESLRRWWYAMGQPRYRRARRLLVTADAGGSNGPKVHPWKVELQKLADEIGRPIAVCHFPPGTSKWNKIEDRLFSFISLNWRGKSLTSHEVIVSLIAGTTATAGLKVRAKLDTHAYPKGVKVARKDFASLNLRPARFHGEWNYVIFPRPE
ncbi:MAG: ISAzo13 family transposase [Acidobacteria bacterium]|nr:ISAzo13 family transposase [Acidobacteriota bacterium]